MEWILFFLGMVFLVWVSRESLTKPRSHGFYRFFAWICMWTMILLAWRDWFVNPFSPLQLISWTLLLIAIALVLSGVQLLRKMGKPDAARNDAPMMAFEKTTQLVTAGIYRYIRHPLYSSLLLLGWGIFFKAVGVWTILLVCGVTVFLTLTARMEESENIRFFGSQYEEYRRQTKMFIPFLF
jgi:protein-S-isoprenylcysteine O-methyltransferase Ste14